MSNLISKAGLNGTLEACRGCTFLIPVDDVFKGAEAWLEGLNDTSIEALIRNHVSPTHLRSQASSGGLCN